MSWTIPKAPRSSIDSIEGFYNPAQWVAEPKIFFTHRHTKPLFIQGKNNTALTEWAEQISGSCIPSTFQATDGEDIRGWIAKAPDYDVKNFAVNLSLNSLQANELGKLGLFSFLHVPANEASDRLNRAFSEFLHWERDDIITEVIHSPANGITRVHADDVETFTIQIVGKKTWSIGPTQKDLKAVTLSPGDRLYMPRRWWHEVTCKDPCISLVVQTLQTRTLRRLINPHLEHLLPTHDQDEEVVGLWPDDIESLEKKISELARYVANLGLNPEMTQICLPPHAYPILAEQIDENTLLLRNPRAELTRINPTKIEVTLPPDTASYAFDFKTAEIRESILSKLSRMETSFTAKDIQKKLPDLDSSEVYESILNLVGTGLYFPKRDYSDPRNQLHNQPNSGS